MDRKRMFGIVLSGLFTAVAMIGTVPFVSANAADSIADKLVNDPSRVWGVFGKTAKAELIKDATVQGGTAERVTVAAKGVNPWDAGANTNIIKPVNSGDTLLLAFWARAEKAPEGQSGVEIVARLQETKAPYTPVGNQETLHLTDKWKMYYVSGVAAQDYPKGAIAGALNIATGAQVFDVGPIMILNFGQNYNPAKLPVNR